MSRFFLLRRAAILVVASTLATLAVAQPLVIKPLAEKKAGEQSIRGADGVKRVEAGHGEAGQRAGSAMQVSSSGSADLHALVMFVVDADKPFSSPASMH